MKKMKLKITFYSIKDNPPAIGCECIIIHGLECVHAVYNGENEFINRNVVTGDLRKFGGAEYWGVLPSTAPILNKIIK